MADEQQTGMDMRALTSQLEELLGQIRAYEATVRKPLGALADLASLLQAAEQQLRQAAQLGKGIDPQFDADMNAQQSLLRSWHRRLEELERSRLTELEQANDEILRLLESEVARRRGAAAAPSQAPGGAPPSPAPVAVQPGVPPAPQSARPAPRPEPEAPVAVAESPWQPRPEPPAATPAWEPPRDVAPPQPEPLRQAAASGAPPGGRGPGPQPPAEPEGQSGVSPLVVELTASPLDSQAELQKIVESIERIPGINRLAVQSFHNRAAQIRFQSTDEAELVVGLQSVRPGAQVRVVSVHDSAVSLSLELPAARAGVG